MTEMTVKEKAASEAAKQNKNQSVAILANKAADSEIDPIDKAILEGELREVLKGLDLVSVSLRKRELAQKYGLKQTEIVSCWKDIQRRMIEALDQKEDKAKNSALDLCKFDPEEAWPDDVKIDDVLNETTKTLKRFIVFKDDYQATAVALWVFTSWFVEYLKFSPYILITSPMKECGKSQLLRCMANLSRRSLLTSNLSAAIVYRVIDMVRPTLFIDEVDTFLKNNDELIGIINAGIEKDGAKAARLEKGVDGKFSPVSFDCFAFKVLAGISAKTISDTITSRSIVIELKRRTNDQVIEKLRDAPEDIWENLKRKYLKAVAQYGEAIKNAKPSIPDFLGDRDGDKWYPLFALADLAGNEQLSRYVRECSRKLKYKDDDSISVSYELLNDIRDIIETGNYGASDFISTADLIGKLIDNPELMWATYNRGQPLSPKQLARRLKEFDIRPRKFKRFGQEVRGYGVESFADSFKRYLNEKTEE